VLVGRSIVDVGVGGSVIDVGVGGSDVDVGIAGVSVGTERVTVGSKSVGGAVQPRRSAARIDITIKGCSFIICFTFYSIPAMNELQLIYSSPNFPSHQIFYDLTIPDVILYKIVPPSS